jgi:single-stranded-DNA-specific exonuclease
VFLARNVEVAGTPRIVGKNHLRFRAKQQGVLFDAIGFGLGHLLPEVSHARGGKNFECVFSIDESEWGAPAGGEGGDTIPQLKIRDLRIESSKKS